MWNENECVFHIFILEMGLQVYMILQKYIQSPLELHEYGYALKYK